MSAGTAADELFAAAAGVAVLLIDGRSGSGKTSLTQTLTARLAATGRDPQVLSVEDLYPGWDGLAAGSRAVGPALDAGEYRRWDWHLDRFGDPVEITAARPLIIEGCGAVTRANLDAASAWARRAAAVTATEMPAAMHAATTAPGASAASAKPAATPAGAAVMSVWIECPAGVRKERALARDGDMFAPHWNRWALQEDAHYAAERPWEIADRVYVAT